MQKIKLINSYFLILFFVAILLSPSNFVLAFNVIGDSPTTGTSIGSGTTSSIPPSSMGAISTSISSSVAKPKQPTARETKQRDALYNWINTECLRYKGPANASCQKERIKDVIALSNNINAIVSKCDELSTGSARKTECVNNTKTALEKNQKTYLIPSDSSKRNKEYLAEIDNVKKQEKNDIKTCKENHSTLTDQQSPRKDCLKEAKTNSFVNKCVAEKVLKEMGKGGKYDPRKYTPGPVPPKDMPTYIKKAKDAAKKDCQLEAVKKASALGTNQG
jgi:hypothetical protein